MTEKHEMLRCEACGGELQYSEDRKSAVCLNCGNTYHFRDEKSEAVIMALNIANARRIACDFDTAVTDYKALIERNPDDAEAHWGLVLSTYGIEYVEDPRTRKHIPTCRRTIRESILENADYKAALANAAPEQRAIYEEKAVIIDRLQKKIKRQLEDEEEYDVFISFKSTDENGNPTKDRQIARRIYDELNNRGIKTFFSEVTLKSRLGEDFEPIIYKALYSCKFFILVATSVENMNSAWVKNEWSRFRDRVFDEALSNPGCAVFENMGPNDLPPFLKGQGVSLAKYPAGGYEIEIADNLSAKFGLTNKNEEAEEIRRQLEGLQEEQRKRQEEQQERQRALEEKLKVIESTPLGASSSGKTADSMIVRAKQFAENGEFENAINKLDEVLDIAPTSSEAWLNLFYFKQNSTIEKGVRLHKDGASTPADYKTLLLDNRNTIHFFNSKYYQNAVRYADESGRKTLLEYQQKVANAEQEIRWKSIKDLITFGMNAVSQRKWGDAEESFCVVLSFEKENAYAYWGLFLRDLKATSISEAAERISKQELGFVFSNKNLLKATECADEVIHKNIAAYFSALICNLQQQVDLNVSRQKEEKDAVKKIEEQITKNRENVVTIVNQTSKSIYSGFPSIENVGKDGGGRAHLPHRNTVNHVEKELVGSVGIAVGFVAAIVCLIAIIICAFAGVPMITALWNWVSTWGTFGEIGLLQLVGFLLVSAAISIGVGLAVALVVSLVGIFFNAIIVAAKNKKIDEINSKIDSYNRLYDKVYDINFMINKLHSDKKKRLDKIDKITADIASDKEFIEKVSSLVQGEKHE